MNVHYGRRGSAMIYTVMVVPVLALLCALSVDWGRVQMVRVELVRACDAAARYAVNGITDGTSLTKANTVGSANAADGQAVTFTPGQVEVGRWDTATLSFVPGGTPYNAVRVSASRSVPTVFAGAFGGAAKTVTVQAIAKRNNLGFGLIGLNSVSLNGNATASYCSAGSGGSTEQGNVASNGNVTVGGSSVINGDVYYGPGAGVFGGGTINGTTSALSAPLSFPNGSSAPYGPTNNDNANVPPFAISGTSFSLGASRHATIQGGHYFFNNFSTHGTSTVKFQGPTVIYCYGTFSMSGTTETEGDIPGNLKIVMVPNPFTGAAPGNVSITGNTDLFASVYAPQSNISVSGNGDLYGSLLGKTVTMTGNGKVFYDMNLDTEGGGGVSLVK